MVTIYKPPVQLAWRKGSVETGSFICINGPYVLLWQQEEAEGMDHFNGTDYGRDKFL